MAADQPPVDLYSRLDSERIVPFVDIAGLFAER
jgi:hypothetical protein